MFSYFRVIAQFSRLFIKAYFRDRVAIFFTFIFPLIFLLVFGSLNRNDRGITFDLAIINQSNSNFSRQFTETITQSDFVKQKAVATLDEGKDLMSKGELDTILLLAPDFGELNESGQPKGQAIVYYDPGRSQTGQTFSTIVDAQLSEINRQITGQTPLFSVERRSTDTRGLSSFDYIFAGLLGFSLLSLGFFGPSNSLPSMKKQGILRRLRTTPLRTSQFIIATAINYLIVGLLAIAFMYLVGVVVFGFKMQGDYLSFAGLTALGAVLMFGFGLAIGGWARNENQAAPLANLTAFPMMFLSGSFFPRFLMPEWLQTISSVLPLTPLIDGIRLIIVEGKTLIEIGPQLALIGGWVIVIYVIAFRVFRWE